MAETARGPEQLEEYTVVDTDVHLRVPFDTIANNLEEPYRSRAKRGIRPSDGWDRYKSGRIDRVTVDTAAHLEENLCDQFYVDHPIINPALAWLDRVPQTDYAVALMRAHNDYLLTEVLDANDDFFGLIQIDTHSPEKAAEEIDRLGGEEQIVGIYLVPMGTEVPIGDPRYDPIYDAAQTHDLTIAFHPHGTTAAMDFPKQSYGFNEYISVHTLSFTWGQQQAIVSLLEQGVPEKFPDLRFTFLEGGVGWVPGLMFRLNKEYAARREEMPLLEKRPEEYMKDFYYASQPLGEPKRASDIQYILNAMDAANTLMFATDYPHWDFDNPSELFRQLLADFTEAERRQILSENAADAFGLSL